MFDQVNYYQHVNTDVDYSSFITALNHVIAIYTKLIKTRETQSKNKKLKAKEAKSDSLAQESIKNYKEIPDADISGTAPINLKETQNGQSTKKEDPSVDVPMNILKKPDMDETDKGMT